MEGSIDIASPRRNSTARIERAVTIRKRCGARGSIIPVMVRTARVRIDAVFACGGMCLLSDSAVMTRISF